MTQSNRMRVSASVAIKAPATELYRILADYRRGHPRVLPAEFRNLEVEEGGFGAGTVIRFQMRVLGTTRILRATITEPQPGRVLVESYLDVDDVTTFTVDPAPSGQDATVSIVTDLAVSQGLRGAVERLVVPRLLKRIYSRELPNLASLAEAGFRV